MAIIHSNVDPGDPLVRLKYGVMQALRMFGSILVARK